MPFRKDRNEGKLRKPQFQWKANDWRAIFIMLFSCYFGLAALIALES